MAMVAATVGSGGNGDDNTPPVRENFKDDDDEEEEDDDDASDSSSIASDTSQEYVAQLAVEWLRLKSKAKAAQDKTDRAFWKFAQARRGLKRIVRQKQKKDALDAKAKAYGKPDAVSKKKRKKD